MTLNADNQYSHDPSRRKILKSGLTTLFAAPIVTSAKTSTPVLNTSNYTTASAPISFAPATDSPANISTLFETIKREATPEQLYRFCI